MNKKKQRPSVSVEQLLAEQMQGAKLRSEQIEHELNIAVIRHVTDLQIRRDIPLPKLAKGMEMPPASVAQTELRGGVNESRLPAMY